jgi:hypothetical protein
LPRKRPLLNSRSVFLKHSVMFCSVKALLGVSHVRQAHKKPSSTSTAILAPFAPMSSH